MRNRAFLIANVGFVPGSARMARFGHSTRCWPSRRVKDLASAWWWSPVSRANRSQILFRLPILIWKVIKADAIKALVKLKCRYCVFKFTWSIKISSEPRMFVQIIACCLLVSALSAVKLLEVTPFFQQGGRKRFADSWSRHRQIVLATADDGWRWRWTVRRRSNGRSFWERRRADGGAFRWRADGGAVWKYGRKPAVPTDAFWPTDGNGTFRRSAARL